MLYKYIYLSITNNIYVYISRAAELRRRHRALREARDFGARGQEMPYLIYMHISISIYLYLYIYISRCAPQLRRRH